MEAAPLLRSEMCALYHGGGDVSTAENRKPPGTAGPPEGEGPRFFGRRRVFFARGARIGPPPAQILQKPARPPGRFVQADDICKSHFPPVNSVKKDENDRIEGEKGGVDERAPLRRRRGIKNPAPGRSRGRVLLWEVCAYARAAVMMAIL